MCDVAARDDARDLYYVSLLCAKLSETVRDVVYSVALRDVARDVHDVISYCYEPNFLRGH